MSDVLDAIDKIANASVEAMNKIPEVPDDVTWAWKILESVDGASVRADVSLTRIIEKLELMSHGSSIISPDAVSYDAEKRLREAVATISDWKERVWNTALELEVAAVRMIIVCEILRLYRSDSDLHDLINHGLVRVIHRMNNGRDDVRLVFDSGETATVVASFPRSVWGDRAVDGLEDADLGNGLIMRDLVNAVRDISYVKPEDLQYLRIDDDGKRKHAISTVVAAYKDEDIDNDLIENDYGDDALYPSIMGAFELTASMRKMLNMVTNYQHRDYFDSISPVQAIVHLVNDNYEPHDIEF